jgi:hypothetical protein
MSSNNNSDEGIEKANQIVLRYYLNELYGPKYKSDSKDYIAKELNNIILPYNSGFHIELKGLESEEPTIEKSKLIKFIKTLVNKQKVNDAKQRANARFSYPPTPVMGGKRRRTHRCKSKKSRKQRRKSHKQSR